MFKYYFLLGVRSLRRNPALTALMVLTLAIGVAASVSTLTILHVMSGDPIPGKSDKIFIPTMDIGPLEGYVPSERDADDQLTYIDAMNLLRSDQGVRKTGLFGTTYALEAGRADLGMLSVEGLAPSRDFFAMFGVPFKYGQPWSEDDDKKGADVVVLSRALSEKLFGEADPVGKRINLEGLPHQIVGVMDKWRMVPKFYRLIGGPGAFGVQEEFMVPLSTAIRNKSGHSGSMSCSARRAPGYQGLLDSECTWIQFYFEMNAAGERAALQNYIDNYSAEQRKLGRMKRNAPNKLYNVMEWLERQKVVGNDNRLSVWLAFGFLLLCLVNTIGLLLAKFSVRAAEVGIRRALGASRREIFQQFLIETGVVGLAGGVLGLLLAFGALALIRTQSDDLATVAHMDWTMLGATFGLSLLAAVLAGLLPTWRACQVTPAIQLKSQ
ncbi:ABC transporter permease [Massilia glaciei]|uniref:ABC transporter permease n=1 Tax=Massilia glaciei TaxID=1524097 RepID=A0A2U2HJ93_9BURK|nr:ABC transporter permease [Massilia glaciei]PWF47579.1 ABC transporter permease [Massilia glaciei]